MGVNRRPSRRPGDRAEVQGAPELEPLEATLESPVRSLAEEGAVARATTDRLRTEANRAWTRARTATERRDALVDEKRRLLAARPAAGGVPAPKGGPAGPGAEEPGAATSVSEWTVASMKADVFKALAHPARVRVLDILAGGERSVGRLAAELGMEISHLSHQLAVLRRSGLVAGRRERSVVFYSLRQPQLSRLLGLVAHELLWSTAPGEPVEPAPTGGVRRSE